MHKASRWVAICFYGILQRDAFESYNKRIDILHYGTKQYIIELEDPGFDDDSFITYISKDMFILILKRSYRCCLCGSETTTDINTQ